jgi:HSP20 family protein
MLWEFDNNLYDPFARLRDLQREVNSIFNSYERNAEVFPAVNIYSNSDELIFTAELPGVEPDDIDISVVQGQLTISGEKKNITGSEDDKCHRQERFNGKFSRSFRLPFDVNNEKVTAKYQNGILKITLPRLEETKPKKIKVAVD